MDIHAYIIILQFQYDSILSLLGVYRFLPTDITEILPKFYRGMMARTVRDAKLESRAARLKLEVNKEPYWKGIDQNSHLGYYKGTRGGKWLARFRKANNTYIKTTFGNTDDIADADGVMFLSFSEAQELARAWFTEQARIDAGLDTSQKDYTVKDAADDYLIWFRSNRKSVKETERMINSYIIKEFSATKLSQLTSKQIRTWLDKLATSQARSRPTKNGTVNLRAVSNSEEDNARKRKSTANRIFTVLKALLNYAYSEGKVCNNEAWDRVKPFKNVDSAKIRYLASDEIIRLINACDSDLKDLVMVGLLTGARYGEITRLERGDYNEDNNTIYIRESKSGIPRFIPLTNEGTALFKRLTAGKALNTRILQKSNGGVWGKSHQSLPLKQACVAANIRPVISYHILRHTYASQLAMKGTPMGVIAKLLGHADTRICEKHYAHLSPNYIADMLRANLPNLGVTVQGNIEKLRLA